MSYADQAILADDAVFQSRVQLATVRAARSVRAQVIDDNVESDATFNKRQSFALKILLNPDVMTNAVAWTLAADPSISAATTDSVLQSNVNDILINLSRG